MGGFIQATARGSQFLLDQIDQPLHVRERGDLVGFEADAELAFQRDDELHVIYAIPFLNIVTGCRLGNLQSRIVYRDRQIIADFFQYFRTSHVLSLSRSCLTPESARLVDANQRISDPALAAKFLYGLPAIGPRVFAVVVYDYVTAGRELVVQVVLCFVGGLFV